MAMSCPLSANEPVAASRKESTENSAVFPLKAKLPASTLKILLLASVAFCPDSAKLPSAGMISTAPSAVREGEIPVRTKEPARA